MEQSPNSTRDSARFVTPVAIVALTILAPALGGSTTLWAKAAIALIVGVLFVLAPPRRSLGLALNLVFLALALLPLIQFLPASWFPLPAWRATLVGFGIHLPDTLSPQPWLTTESTCLFWLGLTWAYYLFACDWNDWRGLAWDIYCLGILGLAAALVTSYALKWPIPFWPNVPEFGFFPNRNQTSNVLGLGGIMIYANAFQHLERGRRRGCFWLGGLGLICWALILNYSRAGIILFFVGALTWHVWWLIRSDPTADTVPRAIAWGPLAILLALLLFAGGETLIRFKESTDFFSAADNGRFQIQRDAFRLFSRSPLLGIGLGNFRSLFSAHHQFFLSESEAIHPESDWLWVATEMGLLAPMLILAGIVLWILRCLPFEPGTWRPMRRAALICGIAFAVHGVFDVSGHRIGALWPALFVAATALHPQAAIPTGIWLSWLFRLLGLAFIAIGSWWFGSILGGVGPPTSVTIERINVEIPQVTRAEQYERLLSLTNRGLEMAPLRWTFYYNRGLAEALLDRPATEISRDFAVARFLMPNWPGLYLKEGAVLLTSDEVDLAFEIWNEGMERLSNPRAFYSDMYSFIKDDPELRERWRQLGHAHRGCLVIFLANANPTEFQIELNRITTEDPDLREFAPDELKQFFELWYQRGEKLSLAETLRAHPEWEQIAWRQLALVYADNQDYRQAYETARRHVTVQLPDVPPNESVDSLSTRFPASKSENDGLLLARAEAEHGQVDDALAVVTALSARPNPSPVIRCVEADILARKGDWAKAWQALWRYVESSNR